LFAGAAAAFAAQHLPGGKNAGAMEPARQDDIVRKGRRFPGEVGKDLLGNVLGQVGIAAGLAERSRIDEREMPGDQPAKGGFGTVRGKGTQELTVIGHRFQIYSRRSLKADRKNWAQCPAFLSCLPAKT
jgi:hypothetical protein